MRRQRERQRRITHADYLEIQRRLSEGDTFEVVGAAVGCSTKTIQRFMLRTGGLLARSQGRSPLRLSVAEREEVSRGLRAGDSLRQIARRLGRAASTVSREVSRNGRRSGYRDWRAEETAVRRSRRPKPGKLLLLPRLRRAVRRRLLERWSPEQIAASLPSEYPDDSEMRVSHETIYRSLFVQARGGLRKELAACLRSGRTRRRPRRRTQLSRSGQLKDMVLISERPAEAADHAVPGHWEGDLIIGKGVTLRDGDSRRTLEPLRDACSSPQWSHRRRRAHRAHTPDLQTFCRASPLAHLGPGEGDGRARTLQHRLQDRRLFLRSGQPVAAREQREHQRPAEAVFPKDRGPERLHPGPAQRCGSPAQRTPSTHLGLDEAIPGVWPICSVDHLRTAGHRWTSCRIRPPNPVTLGCLRSTTPRSSAVARPEPRPPRSTRGASWPSTRSSSPAPPGEPSRTDRSDGASRCASPVRPGWLAGREARPGPWGGLSAAWRR